MVYLIYHGQNYCTDLFEEPLFLTNGFEDLEAIAIRDVFGWTRYRKKIKICCYLIFFMLLLVFNYSIIIKAQTEINIKSDESPIKDKNGYLLVKCTYCGQFFHPEQGDIAKRVQTLKGNYTGENRLYCSNNCKTACPVFGTRVRPKDHKPATSREVQPELRQMRLACDEYSCQMCGKNIDQSELHCHHIEGVMQNPIESADLDNTITLCKKCHRWVHSEEGCRYFELRCN